MEEIVKRIRQRLGEPLRIVEINDEQFSGLFEIAKEEWELYSTLSNLESTTLSNIKNYWINAYFSALSKESLGRIRGKFSGNINGPDGDVKLDYIELLNESAYEKDRLINLL